MMRNRPLGASEDGQLGARRLRTEGPCRITLRPLCRRELPLSRQLFDPPFSVLGARQRREKSNEVVDILFGQGEWLDFLVEMGVMQTGALVVVVDDIPECLLRAVVKSKALSPARCACPVSWLRMSVKAAQRQLPPSEAQYTIVLAAPSSFQAPAPSGSPCNEQPSRSSAASGKLSHAAPAWLARFDQFQIDRGEPKNPDHRRLRRALLDTVIMRLVGDSPDKPPAGAGTVSFGSKSAPLFTHHVPDSTKHRRSVA